MQTSPAEEEDEETAQKPENDKKSTPIIISKAAIAPYLVFLFRGSLFFNSIGSNCKGKSADSGTEE